MRYIMRQKVFCLGDDYTIRDADGRDVFFVDGRAFSIGDKLAFEDMAGRELAFIRQRLLSWGPTYEIHRAGRLAALVKKQLFTLLRCRFTVDVPGPDDLEAAGDFLDREYTFERGGCQRGHRLKAMVHARGHLRRRYRPRAGRCSHPGRDGRDRSRLPRRST